MVRDVKMQFDGKEYSLLYCGRAMLVAQDTFTDMSVLDIVGDRTVAGWDNLCKLAGILAEHGEEVRRRRKYTPQDMLDAEYLQIAALPHELVMVRDAVFNAVMLGLEREEKENNGEIDLGLQELQKKSE